VIAAAWENLTERRITMSEIVYVFTNPAMPCYVKIGMTKQDDVTDRLKALSSPTGVPVPFECRYAAEVDDSAKIEKVLKEALDNYRHSKRREFFLVPHEKAIALLKKYAISDKTPEIQKVLAEITSPEDKSAQAQAASAYALRNRWWTFSEIGIKPGEELELVSDPTIKCKVFDNQQSVEYAGKTFPSLSALARELGRWSEKDPSAPEQFSYKGELLSDIRKKYAE